MSIKVFNINDTWDDIFIDGIYKDKSGEQRYIYAIKNNRAINFHLKSPKLNLIFKPNFNSVKFNLHPFWTETKAFVELIKDIEKRVKQFCQIHYQGHKFKSIINLKKNEQKTIKFYLDKKCKVYDSNKELKSIEDLENNMSVSLLLKVSHFWVSENKISLYISILAFKYYPSIKDYDVIDFIDDDEETIIYPPKYPVKTVYQCLNCQSNFCHYGKTALAPLQSNMGMTMAMNMPPPPPPPMRKAEIKQIVKSGFVPNPSDLLNMITKLKSVKTTLSN
jgi:hypothetical protein